jgi:hypothetical protein
MGTLLVPILLLWASNFGLSYFTHFGVKWTFFPAMRDQVKGGVFYGYESISRAG